MPGDYGGFCPVHQRAYPCPVCTSVPSPPPGIAFIESHAACQARIDSLTTELAERTRERDEARESAARRNIKGRKWRARARHAELEQARIKLAIEEAADRECEDVGSQNGMTCLQFFAPDDDEDNLCPRCVFEQFAEKVLGKARPENES